MEEAHLEIPAQAYFPSFTLHSAHTTHTYQLPSSPWAGALD